jgi:hypothetical protein
MFSKPKYSKFKFQHPILANEKVSTVFANHYMYNIGHIEEMLAPNITTGMEQYSPTSFFWWYIPDVMLIAEYRKVLATENTISVSIHKIIREIESRTDVHCFLSDDLSKLYVNYRVRRSSKLREFKDISVQGKKNVESKLDVCLTVGKQLVTIYKPTNK